jgi:8-oxo-dGTP pyrophosphatase MutT (NUDIX family)
MKYRNKEHSVAGVVFNSDQSEVLLVKRRDVPVWVLPGGAIDEEESFAQATTREIQEETGYFVNIKRKVGEFHPKNKLTKITHLYECTIVKGSARESDETSEIKFFPINALPKLMPPPYHEWICYALQNHKKPIIKKTESVTYLVLAEKALRHPKLVIKYFINRLKLRLFNYK